VLGVDQRGKGRLRRVVPFASRGLASSILRGGDDLEIFIL
jgi:hypothetical protein